jgi:hypothetical protein
LLPTSWVRCTSLGNPDSTAQSSVNAGTISGVLRIANATRKNKSEVKHWLSYVQYVHLRCSP